MKKKYSELIQSFLTMVQKIKSLNPTYRQPGDGSDGTCDCIGLIIGAIRRMGLKWVGIHGSNWAARKEFVELKRVNSESDYELGDTVLKAYEYGDKGWNLPARYRKGGKYYNGDLRDYYHAGVVTSVNPLNITHMSSKMTVDKKMGRWLYHGKLKIIVNASSDNGAISAPAATTPTKETDPGTGVKAAVTAASGKYVKMRAKPTQSCSLYDEVPVGATVTLVAPGETWAQISYGQRTGWYMMAKYLKVQS